GGAELPPRRQVPFADGERAVSRVPQDSGQRRRRPRDLSVVPRKSDRYVAEKSHPHRVMVAAGENRSAGGGAERGDVKPAIPQAFLGEPVNRRRGDIGAETTELSKSEVVEDDQDDVRTARLRPRERREGGRRFGDGAADDRSGAVWCGHDRTTQ